MAKKRISSDDDLCRDVLAAFERAVMRYPVHEKPRNVAENLMLLTEQELQRMDAERAEKKEKLK